MSRRIEPQARHDNKRSNTGKPEGGKALRSRPCLRGEMPATLKPQRVADRVPGPACERTQPEEGALRERSTVARILRSHRRRELLPLLAVDQQQASDDREHRQTHPAQALSGVSVNACNRRSEWNDQGKRGDDQGGERTAATLDCCRKQQVIEQVSNGGEPQGLDPVGPVESA